MAEQGELRSWKDDLASVARGIARLLVQDRYDEAELAELDQRRDALKARIRELEEDLSLGAPGSPRSDYQQ